MCTRLPPGTACLPACLVASNPQPLPPPIPLHFPGVYIATMMATVQTLQEKGHPYSEICNEVRRGAGRAQLAQLRLS